MAPFAISLLLTFTLFPFPTLAHPVTPSGLDARQISSTKIGGNLAFDIAFPLGWPTTFRPLPTSCLIYL